MPENSELQCGDCKERNYSTTKNRKRRRNGWNSRSLQPLP